MRVTIVLEEPGPATVTQPCRTQSLPAPGQAGSAGCGARSSLLSPLLLGKRPWLMIQEPLWHLHGHTGTEPSASPCHHPAKFAMTEVMRAQGCPARARSYCFPCIRFIPIILQQGSNSPSQACWGHPDQQPQHSTALQHSSPISTARHSLATPSQRFQAKNTLFPAGNTLLPRPGARSHTGSDPCAGRLLQRPRHTARGAEPWPPCPLQCTQPGGDSQAGEEGWGQREPGSTAQTQPSSPSIHTRADTSGYISVQQSPARTDHRLRENSSLLLSPLHKMPWCTKTQTEQASVQNFPATSITSHHTLDTTSTSRCWGCSWRQHPGIRTSSTIPLSPQPQSKLCNTSSKDGSKK